MDRDSVGGLASLLFEKTKGNPHAVVQLLQHLKAKNLLTYIDEIYNWAWDMNAIESEVSDNPAEIIAEKVGRLRPEEQEALKMAAFLGNSFDAELLHFILFPEHQDQSSAGIGHLHGTNEATHREATHLACLQNPVKDGLIKESGVGHYRFSRDSIQH
jgi:predicted ATPase